MRLRWHGASHCLIDYTKHKRENRFLVPSTLWLTLTHYPSSMLWNKSSFVYIIPNLDGIFIKTRFKSKLCKWSQESFTIPVARLIIALPHRGSLNHYRTFHQLWSTRYWGPLSSLSLSLDHVMILKLHQAKAICTSYSSFNNSASTLFEHLIQKSWSLCESIMIKSSLQRHRRVKIGYAWGTNQICQTAPSYESASLKKLRI